MSVFDQAAVKTALAIQIDALAERETVVPGESLGIGVKVYLHGLQKAEVKDVTWSSPGDWRVTQAQPPAENNAAFNRRENADFAVYYRVEVPMSAMPTEPYWLEKDRHGAMF